jgi:hypothetical protein
MTPEFIRQAEAELSDIDRKLAEVIALQQRGEQLRALIALGRQLYLGEQPAEQRAVLTLTPSPALTHKAPKAVTQKERIIDACAAVLADAGASSTRGLLDRLAANGIEVGGADKIAALSAILSRSDRFKSDRAAGGWVLDTSHKEETPPGAPTPAGS